jgi:hypothetical protein
MRGAGVGGGGGGRGLGRIVGAKLLNKGLGLSASGLL